MNEVTDNPRARQQVPAALDPMARTPPRSAVEQVAWPALPEPRHARLLALTHQLQQSQWWPADRLLAHQEHQLRALLDFARQQVPFYRDRLAGLGEVKGSLTASDWWRRLPTVSRTDLQDRLPRLRADTLPAAHGAARTVSTSGSTGTPVSADVSGLAQLFSAACTLRGHAWWGRDVTGTLAMINHERSGIAAAPEGHRQAEWGWPTSALYRTGPAAVLDVGTPFDQQLDWLRRLDPDYLVIPPSALQQLLELSRRRGVRIPGLKSVSTVSETVDDELRADCLDVWEVPIQDTYSTKEAGVIALQCPQAMSYHVMAETGFVEVLDDDGRPCVAGERGRLVVTRLHNFAMPLIRYEIGDYAETGAACACGRTLPVLTRILGRTRNMFRLPSGEAFWPSFGRRAAAAIAPIRQHQLVQTGPAIIEARLVVERPLTGDEESRLRELFVSRLAYPFEIRFAYPAALPRGPGGKYEYFRCELDRYAQYLQPVKDPD